MKKTQSLTRTIASPYMAQPKRIPTFPNVDRTAVVDFNRPGKLTVTTSPNRVLLTRQPVYPMWSTVEIANEGAIGYAVGYVPAAGSEMAVDYTLPKETVMLRYSDPLAPTWAIDELTNPGRPNFQIAPGVSGSNAYSAPIMGYDTKVDPIPFIYVPKFSTLRVAVSHSLPNGNTNSDYTLYYEVWNQPGEIVKGAYTFNAGDGVNRVAYIDIPIYGWLRPRSLLRASGYAQKVQPCMWLFVLPGAPPLTSTLSVADSTPQVQVTGTTTVPIMMPVPFASDYWVSPAPFSNTRVTAAALNIQNVTKALDKEGTIMCGRVNPATTDPWNVSSAQIATFHPLEKTQLSMQDGVYTFTLPSPEAERYLDYILPVSLHRGNFDTPSSVTGIPAMDLSSTAYWNVMIFEDPDGGSKMAYNLDWHIEFRTTSTLWDIDFSRESIETYHRAVMALNRMRFFTTARRSGPGTSLPTYLEGTRKPKLKGGKTDKKKKEKKQEKAKPAASQKPKPAPKPAAKKSPP